MRITLLVLLRALLVVMASVSFGMWQGSVQAGMFVLCLLFFVTELE